MLLKTFEIIAIVAAIVLYFSTTIYGFKKDRFSQYCFYKNRPTSNKVIIIGQIVTVIVAGIISFFISPIKSEMINTAWFNLILAISSLLLLVKSRGFSKAHKNLHEVNIILILIIFYGILLIYEVSLLLAT